MKSFLVIFVLALTLKFSTAIFVRDPEHIVPAEEAAKYFEDFVDYCEKTQNNNRRCISAKQLLNHYKVDKDLKRDEITNVEVKLSDFVHSYDKEEGRTCTYYHVPSTLYVRKIELVNETSGYERFSLIGCTELKDGVTVGKSGVCIPGTTCKKMREIVGWYNDEDLPATSLPENVSYRIGPKSEFKYLGISTLGNSETLRVRANGLEGDNSGFVLEVGPETDFLMGMVVSVLHQKIPSNRNALTIPPRSRAFRVGGSCSIHNTRPVSVFGYTANTRQHGTKVSAYLYSSLTKTTKPIFTINPQDTPKKVVRLNKETIVHPNDVLLFSCTYNTMNEQQEIKFGSNMDQEFCYVKLLFSTDSRDNSDLDIRCEGDEIIDRSIWSAVGIY